jgi:hypothetical protein
MCTRLGVKRMIDYSSILVYSRCVRGMLFSKAEV